MVGSLSIMQRLGLLPAWQLSSHHSQVMGDKDTLYLIRWGESSQSLRSTNVWPGRLSCLAACSNSGSGHSWSSPGWSWSEPGCSLTFCHNDYWHSLTDCQLHHNNPSLCCPTVLPPIPKAARPLLENWEPSRVESWVESGVGVQLVLVQPPQQSVAVRMADPPQPVADDPTTTMTYQVLSSPLTDHPHMSHPLVSGSSSLHIPHILLSWLIAAIK